MVEVSVKKICEKIWDLENEYDLLNKEIEGVKVWQLTRFIVYSEIAEKTGTFTKPHTIKNSWSDKIKAFPSYFHNTLIKNPLSGNYEKEILIFDHPRKIAIDGDNIDIYTKYYIDELDDDKYDVIERPYLNKHISKKEKNRKYLDYLYLVSYLPIELSEVKFINKDLIWIQKLQNEINTYFDIEIDLVKLFSMNIIKYKCYYKFYLKLLEKRKCKTVVLVVSYLPINIPLIAAAKENGIQVIEIQHGTIGPYHLGYNFPNYDSELAYFPDIFYSFGEYWSETIEFPIDKENIIPYGFPHLKNRIKQYEQISKIDKQILFISQGAIGKELSKFAYEVAQALDEYSIIYKLHPGEYDRWKDEYKELVLASKLKNVTVIDNNQRELYSYFAESEYQIGVFSTAIYEGLAFNCKTLLVNLPGIEYMKYLIEKGIAKKITNIEQLKTQIKGFTTKHYNEEYFFA